MQSFIAFRFHDRTIKLLFRLLDSPRLHDGSLLAEYWLCTLRFWHSFLLSIEYLSVYGCPIQSFFGLALPLTEYGLCTLRLMSCLFDGCRMSFGSWLSTSIIRLAGCSAGRWYMRSGCSFDTGCSFGTGCLAIA